MRTQVEYVKEPKTIDEAVDAVVSYMEASKSITMQTDRRQRSGARMVAPQEDPDEDEEGDLNHYSLELLAWVHPNR